MFSKPDAPSTPRGADFKSPLYMTGSWMTFAGLAMIPVLALVIGIVAAVKFKTLAPLVAGVIIAVPFGVAAALMFYFTLRSTLMIYPTQPKQPKITDGPTVVFVRDQVKTPKGYVEKDAIPVDIGLPPNEARRVLEWMKANGEVSRRKVCDGTGISQSAWAKLKNALQDFGILDGGKLTDEVDYLLAQLDDL